MALELGLLGLFLTAWCLALLSVAAGAPLAGVLPLNLYQLYAVAAATGWLAGNLYMARGRGLPAALRRRLLLIYLLGPPSLPYLLSTLAPASQQMQAPLAFLWASAVFAILFMVPVTLRRGSKAEPPKTSG